MSTALALAPSDHNSPHLQSRDSDPHAHHSTSRQYASTTSAGGSASSPPRTMSSPSSRPAAHGDVSPAANDQAVRGSQNAPGSSPHKQNSPASGGSNSASKMPRSFPPKIKTEQPPSPETSRPVQSSTPARHRPRRLDLSNSNQASQGLGSARLTSRESAPLSAIQDVGLACLSPGFQTQDPTMQQQLARSMDVREQQRHIIEARLNNKSGKEPAAAGSKEAGSNSNTFAKPPGTSKRKGPPPGLSITAPSATQFASEPRVIQSAPLHQTFTGLRPGQHPLARQAVEHRHEQQRHNLANEQHNTPLQSSTRLPPIQDIISQPADSFSRSNSGPSYGPISSHHNRSPQSNHPVHSPGFPPTSSRPQREREFRSAEEAVQSMTGGREDLLPKIVHYGGHQPPTPPSPQPPSSQHQAQYQQAPAGPSTSSHGPSHQDAPAHYHNHHANHVDASRGHPSGTTARRRNRDSFERDHHSDPEATDANARESKRIATGPFGYGRDSPETQRQKKDEFMALCARAWDLFHS